jgi:PEP-CTERM motif
MKMRNIVRSSLLLLCLQACLVMETRADLFTSSFNTSGAPTVTITSSGDSGTFYAGPFSVTDTTQNVSFKAFCVDLATTVGTGPTGFSAAVYPIASASSGGSAPSFPDARGNITNELAYMGSQYASHSSGWNQAQLGAFQAVLWYFIDKNFSLQSSSDSNLTTAYNSLISQYDASEHYSSSGVVLWLEPQAGRNYQNLVAFAAPGDPLPLTPVPEPSSLVLALLGGGLIGMVGLRKGRSGQGREA